jgi:hypothetical protein
MPQPETVDHPWRLLPPKPEPLDPNVVFLHTVPIEWAGRTDNSEAE